MFRIELSCNGVPEEAGARAAADIANEFKEYRADRYAHVTCVFTNGCLVLGANNDGWDANGLALMDEFSDCLSAFIGTPFDGQIRIVSSTRMNEEPR